MESLYRRRVPHGFLDSTDQFKIFKIVSNNGSPPILGTATRVPLQIRRRLEAEGRPLSAGGDGVPGLAVIFGRAQILHPRFSSQ